MTREAGPPEPREARPEEVPEGPGAKLFVGTSGYSYRDWIGPFYPPGTRQDEMLGLYARRFGAVELNFSYYGIPKAKTLEAMADRTPEDFLFTLKLHRSLTHEREEAAKHVWAFREAMRPLVERGRLGCLLAQFPGGFEGSRPNCEYLLWLAGQLEGPRLVVEFRHRSWDKDEVAPWLARHRIGLCSVDLPELQGLPAPLARLGDPGVGYVRFHGRNSASWWQHEQAHERYQYDYSPDELEEWVPKVKTLAAEAQVLYVFFNNHFGGQAAKNAEMFRSMLEQASER